jgi:hypothetical protein
VVAGPDSATGLGVAPTGQEGRADVGVLGIANGRAYAPAVASTATVAAPADGRVGVQTDTDAEGESLQFRWADANNRFSVAGVGAPGDVASYTLYRVQGGVAQAVAAGIAAARDGDWLEVELSGSAIAIYVNGRLAWSGTDAFNQTTGRHGRTPPPGRRGTRTSTCSRPPRPHRTCSCPP